MFTYWIIGLTVLSSLVAFEKPVLFDKLKFNAYDVKRFKSYYRLFSHAFVHGDLMHLLVNMFVLWSFGQHVESLMGLIFGSFSWILFLILYVGGVVMASLPSLKKHADNPYYNAVGASGGVAAILFSFILMQPLSMLGLFLVIPIPAFLFGVLYIWYESSMQNKRDGIAHDAHVVGALFGFTFTILLKPSLILDFVLQIKEGVSGFLGF
jgi:membrane associated rhomboid family serine protease